MKIKDLTAQRAGEFLLLNPFPASRSISPFGRVVFGPDDKPMWTWATDDKYPVIRSISVQLAQDKNTNTVFIEVYDPKLLVYDALFNYSDSVGGLTPISSTQSQDNSNPSPTTSTGSNSTSITEGTEDATIDVKVRAFLDTIAAGEVGTPGVGNLLGDNGYNVSNGGGTFSSYNDHPHPGTERAAGRYQFLPSTWAGLKSQQSYADFNKINQDKGAIALIKEKKAYDAILRGKLDKAIQLLRGTWTSFPGAREARWISNQQFINYYNERLKAYGSGNTTTSTPITQLNSNNQQVPPLVAALGGVLSSNPQKGAPNETYKYEYRKIPTSFISVGNGAKMEKAAGEAFKRMQKAAKANNPSIDIHPAGSISGYRSIKQAEMNLGGSKDYSSKAPPGYSQHHTGRAIDINDPTSANTNQIIQSPWFKWLQANAAKYGFVLGHPQDVNDGPIYEPWHWVWIGDSNSTSNPTSTASSVNEAVTAVSQSQPKTLEQIQAIKGAQIRVDLGYSPTNYTSFWFIHTRHSCRRSGLDTTVITGHSPTWMMGVQKQNSAYQNLTLKQLAQKVATRYGLKLDMSVDGPKLTFTDQRGISDYQLLERECDYVGYQVYISAKENLKTLVIKPRAATELAFVLRPYVNMDYLELEDNASTDGSGSSTSSTGNAESITGEIKVYTDPLEGIPKEQQKDTLAHQKNPDGRTTKSGATAPPLKSTYDKFQNNYPNQRKDVKRTKGGAKGTAVFTTSDASLRLSPDTPFATEGLPGTISRVWVIDKVTHELKGGNLKTRIDFFTPREPKPGQDSNSNTNNEPVVSSTSTNPGGFIKPTNKGNYSRSLGGGHDGIDIGNPAVTGEPIFASASGIVTVAHTGCPLGRDSECGGGYGNHVYIDHGDGVETRYAHMKSVSVRIGQRVIQGQQIGELGYSGRNRPPGPKGAHLHFELRRNGVPQEPLDYFKYEPQ